MARGKEKFIILILNQKKKIGKNAKSLSDLLFYFLLTCPHKRENDEFKLVTSAS
jgi:hypothetical protein